MAKNRYAPDKGLTRRMVATMTGLGVVYVLVVILLISLGFGAIWVLVIAGGMLWAHWFFSDTLALKSMRAQEVSPEQAPLLHGMVDRLCVLADMPKPKVCIADTDIPNAFATGRSKNRSSVCVTTGLLRRTDQQELEAVLAHELSHVAHRDVTVMTIATFGAIVAGVVMRTAMWGGMMGGRRDSSGIVFLTIAMSVMVVSALVYVISHLLTAALSRYRELAADRGGALLTGNPGALASALQKISGEVAQIPTKDLRSMEPVSAMAFIPALSAQGGLNVMRLFHSHPSLEKRLDNLAKISTELSK